MRALIGFLCLLPLAAFAERWSIAPEFWLAPRSGAQVLAQPAVAEAVRRLIQQPKARLVFHHARDDEAQAQVEELRGWLTALGIDPLSIELAGDGGVDRVVWIEVTPP